MAPHNQSLKITAVWVCLILLLSGVALAAEPQRGGTLTVSETRKPSPACGRSMPRWIASRSWSRWRRASIC